MKANKSRSNPAAQKRGWPKRWAPPSTLSSRNWGKQPQSRRRSHRRIKGRGELGAHRGDDGNNHHRDQGGNQRIFDGRGAAGVGGQVLHKRSRSMGISGKSAAGMG